MTQLKRVLQFLATLLVKVLAVAQNTPYANAASLVQFVPPSTISGVNVESTFSFSFLFTGGSASQAIDCNSITGFDVSISISDSLGHTSTTGAISNYPAGDFPTTVSGLWGPGGWSSSLISNGLKCTWSYSGAFHADPVAASANLFSVNWQSSSGSVLGTQSGSWSTPLAKDTAPSVYLSGIGSDANVSSPTVVQVSALASTSNPITDFDVEPAGAATLWVNNPIQGWEKNPGYAICGPISTSSTVNGLSTYSTSCEVVPTNGASPLLLAAFAFTANHASYQSSPVRIIQSSQERYLNSSFWCTQEVHDLSGHVTTFLGALGDVDGKIMAMQTTAMPNRYCPTYNLFSRLIINSM